MPLNPASLADLLGALLDEVVLAPADVALRFRPGHEGSVGIIPLRLLLPPPRPCLPPFAHGSERVLRPPPPPPFSRSSTPILKCPALVLKTRMISSVSSDF